MNRFIYKIAIVILLFLHVAGCDKNNNIILPAGDREYGIIRDYSHLDGCALVIELESGDIVVPINLDTTLILYDGQEVYVSFKKRTDLANTCMVGTVVEIEKLHFTDCLPIIIPISAYDWLDDSLPTDPFAIQDADIINDCLQVIVNYGGGCEVHTFIMTYSYLPHFCAFEGELLLAHNANGDLCEAWITDTLSFDLTSLQQQDADNIRVMLRQNVDGSDYQLLIDYFYK